MSEPNWNKWREYLGKLINEVYSKGYKIRIGDVLARDSDKNPDGTRTHKSNSQHYKKLAVDINLFKDGVFLSKTGVS